MKKYHFAATAVFALAFVACSNDDGPKPVGPEPGENPSILTGWQPEPLHTLAKANVGKTNGFALDLFKKTLATGEENLCLSPVSVFASLAMAANGDSGATRDEVLDLLGYGRCDLSQLNIFCNALLTETKALNGGTECAYANSFWYRPDLKPREAYLSALQLIFDASVYDTWLGDQSGMKKVNDYISTNTRGLIPQFLSEPLNVDMALINTTYFKGTWKEKFGQSLINCVTFHNLDGSSAIADFMGKEGEIEVAETSSLRSVRLPYAGDRFTMTLIQPAGDSDFPQMMSELTPSTLRTLDESYHPRESYLMMPRFEAGVNLDLLDMLKEMGLKLGCESGFNGICEGETFSIKCVKHGVKIIVNEEGTEAAGATLVGLDNAAPSTISFDHPFVYLIRDTISDTILFIGAVTKF